MNKSLWRLIRICPSVHPGLWTGVQCTTALAPVLNDELRCQSAAAENGAPQGPQRRLRRKQKGWNTQQIEPNWGPCFCSQAVPKSEQCSGSLGTSAHRCRVHGSRCSAPTAAIWRLFKAFAILVAQNLSNPYLYLCTACVYSFLSFANAGFQFKQLFFFPHSSLSQHN